MAADADDRLAFHRTLPAKRMGAGAIVRDPSGRVLIVKPTYKEGWELPGGAVEDGESPAEATTLLVERAGRRLATVLSGDRRAEVYLENQRPR